MIDIYDLKAALLLLPFTHFKLMNYTSKKITYYWSNFTWPSENVHFLTSPLLAAQQQFDAEHPL